MPNIIMVSPVVYERKKYQLENQINDYKSKLYSVIKQMLRFIIRQYYLTDKQVDYHRKKYSQYKYYIIINIIIKKLFYADLQNDGINRHDNSPAAVQGKRIDAACIKDLYAVPFKQQMERKHHRTHHEIDTELVVQKRIG